VLLVAFLLAYSAKSVGKAYNALSQVEWWARMLTGWLFILVGIWFSLTYVFELRQSEGGGGGAKSCAVWGSASWLM